MHSMELCLLLNRERNDTAPLFGADDLLLYLSIFLAVVRHIELTNGRSIALDLPLHAHVSRIMFVAALWVQERRLQFTDHTLKQTRMCKIKLTLTQVGEKYGLTCIENWENELGFFKQNIQRWSLNDWIG